jgi:hypothetical protein
MACCACSSVAAACSPKLAGANAGEWGIALEGVCAYLDEYAAIVGDELFSEIERLATAMQLNDDCWKRLERTPYRD